MKKYVGKYVQKKLLEYEGLDAVDVLLLGYLEDFVVSGHMKEYWKDNKTWGWISWKKIHSDLPILNVTVSMVKEKCLFRLGTRPDDYEKRYENASANYKKRMERYKYFGLVEFETVKENNVERTIWRFTDKYYLLKPEFYEGEEERKKGPTDSLTTKSVEPFSIIVHSITLNVEHMQYLNSIGFEFEDIKSLTKNQLLNLLERYEINKNI